MLHDVVLDRVECHILTLSSLMREEFDVKLWLVVIIWIASCLRVVVPSSASVVSGSLTSSSFVVRWGSHVIVVGWSLGPFS